jgi:hypothetical protein
MRPDGAILAMTRSQSAKTGYVVAPQICEFVKACTVVGLDRIEGRESVKGDKWQQYGCLIVYDQRDRAIRNMVAAGTAGDTAVESAKLQGAERVSVKLVKNVHHGTLDIAGA